MSGEINPDSGPVMVTVEYLIEPERAAEFEHAMQPLRTIRLRDGAIFWGLFFDTAQPGRFIEYFAGRVMAGASAPARARGAGRPGRRAARILISHRNVAAGGLASDLGRAHRRIERGILCPRRSARAAANRPRIASAGSRRET